MSTVTKLGAYGLAVVAAFAVAFAVLVTAPRTSVDAHILTTGNDEDLVPVADVSVEAYTEAAGPSTTNDGDDTNDVAAFGRPSAVPEKRAGDSVYIRVFDVGPGDADPDDDHTNDDAEAGSLDTLFRFSVHSSSDASGTFKSGGKATLNCRDNRGTAATGCDMDRDIDEMTVQFDIADDAENGDDLVIQVQNIDDNKSVTVRFEIVGSALSTSKLDVQLVSGSSLSRPATGNEGENAHEAQFRVRVLDNQQPAEDFEGRKVSLTVTRGVLRTSGVSPGCRTVTQCTVTTDHDGFWTQVRGTGQPGPSTLTIVADGFTQTRTITFYGTAKKIEAEAEQNSVQLGGTVFIVVTVTDGAGNGISGRNPTVATGNDRVKGPTENAVAVQTSTTVMKDVAGTANDLPACATDTNSKGKCVIQVTAQNPTGTDNDAARGTHTVTIMGAAPIATADRKVKVEIAVSGAADRVTTNAPDRVDSGSTTSITATVVDDEGVRAGAQSVKVTKIAGPGVVRNGGPATTKDGAHTFEYRAPSGEGSAEFEVEVRALVNGAATETGKVLARTSFIIAVGAEPAPPPPAPEPEPTAAGVTSDAPDRVAPGSSTDITVTVTDADGDRAGRQSVTATQVSGDGRIINGGPAATDDGRYTFTFRAASTVGVAEIDVDVRSLVDGAATTTGRVLATLSLTIQVGEPPAPAATLTPAPSGSGVALTSFSGGTVSELQALLLDTCSSGSVAAYATARGGYVPFIPGARIAAVNAAFMSAVAVDGMVPAGQLLLVSGCD